MNRRHFLRTLGIGTALAVGGLAVATPKPDTSLAIMQEAAASCSKWPWVHSCIRSGRQFGKNSYQDHLIAVALEDSKLQSDGTHLVWARMETGP